MSISRFSKSFFGLFIIALLSIAITPYKAEASHAQGAQITYTCVGPNQYQVLVSFFRDCDGISPPSSVTIEAFSPSGCSSATPSWTIDSTGCSGLSQIQDPDGNPYGYGEQVRECPGGGEPTTNCNDPNSSYPGTEFTFYCTTITLPSQCSDWVIGYSICCRNDQITNLDNPSSDDQYVYATINNTIDPNTGQQYCNNSAFFINEPNDKICPGQAYNYNHSAIDVDGDSLVFSSIAPLDDYNVPVTYAPGLGPNNPFNNSNYFNFNSATGQIGAFPNGQQTIALTVLVEEYRDGVLIGTTMRDVQVIVLPPAFCNNNNFTGQFVDDLPQGAGILGPGSTGADSLQMCPGNTVSFDIKNSAAGADTISMSVSNLMSGASFTINYPSPDTIVGSFSWTPTISDTGFNTFTVEVTACYSGANAPQSSTITYSIYVFDEVVVSPSTATYCGDPIQLNAIGGSSFTWSPVAGLDDPNIPNPIATPSVSTNYIVTSDCGVDSVFVNVSQPYAPDAGQDTSICLNSIVQLNASAPAQFGPYTYEWTPAAGLNNPNVRTPIASPDTATQYLLTTTSAQGCEKTDSVTVSISGVAPSVTAFAEPDTVCPGQFVQLDLSVAPSQCGISPAPCQGSTAYEVGTDNTADDLTTPYNGRWEDSRVVYLFRASELANLGVNGGVIQEIAFFVDAINSTAPYNGFNIRMGCTTDDVVPSSFPSGLSNVYSANSVTPNVGWNNYVLDNAYDWDGVSNLYVEVCFNNSDWTSSDDVRYTTTPFQSVIYADRDGSLGCAIASEGTSDERPNTRFNVCVPSVQNATISWTPSTYISDPSIPNPQAQVFGTTNFIANVEEGGCTGSGVVEVYVEPTVSVEATPDTGLCSPVPVQLQANTTGTPSPILLTCGTNGTACGATNRVATIGSATATTANTTPFKNDNDDYRVQYLIRASELDAAGFERGIIQSIAFEVTSNNTGNNPLENFQVSMGCTQLDVMGSDFITGLDVVYTPKNYTSTAGQNTIVFDNPYDWDGTSNIVINICFDNPFSSINGSDIIRFTPSGYNSVLYSEVLLGPGGCNLNQSNNPVNSSEFRPDITLDICEPPAGTFSYVWSPSATLDDDSLQNPIASPTNSEVYTVTVTDGTCLAFDSLEVDFINGFDLNLTGLNVGCNGASDGNISSTPAGANAPYDFQWGAPINQTTLGADADTIFNLSAGIYYLTVTDNSGCIQVDSFELTVPPPLNDSIRGNDLSCFGASDGSAEVFPYGGTPPYDFSWSGFPLEDSSYIAGLDTGTYVVVITDSTNCTHIDSVTIDQPTEITYSVDSTEVSCFGYSDGSAEITVTGGGTTPYNYLWSDSQTTALATSLASGMYFFTVTDANSCSITDSVFVPERDSFSIDLQVLPVSCFTSSDGFGFASVGGDTVNYSFSWLSNPSIDNALTNQLPEGQITVEVTDTNSCVQTKDTVIGAPDPIVLDATADSIACNGGSDGSAEVSVVSGGTAPFSYVWNNGDSTAIADSLSAGTYYVTVVDDQACEAYDTVQIYEPDSMDLTAQTQNVSCSGNTDGQIEVYVDGGTAPYSYLWDDGSTQSFRYDLVAGEYDVTVTDNNGCVDSLTNIEIEEASPLQVTQLSSTPVTCPWSTDGAIFISVDGGTGSYTYDIGSARGDISVFNSLSPGNYDIEITDDRGCSIDTSIAVEAPDSVYLSFDPDELFITLSDDTILQPIVDSNGRDIRYSWAPSATLSCDSCETPSASPVVTTVYELTIFDENNCPYSDRITVNVDNNLILFVPSAFSPNGDDNNDLLKAYGVSIDYIDFSIYNRWGERVFYTNDISEGWDGTYQGNVMPPDTYVYFIEAFYADGQKKSIEGSITLIK